jgi:N4-gp56 family major capsid protein
MGMQGYSTVQSRNLIRAAQDMLAHAQPVTVLGDFGTMKEVPKNATETLVFRRTLPLFANPAGLTAGGAAVMGSVAKDTTAGELAGRYQGIPGGMGLNPGAFQLTEGQTPNANTVTFQDVSVTLANWGILFKFSSKVELLYEDDIPAEMVKLTGETMAEVLEQVRYGVLKAGSTVIYANGVSRSQVNSAISLNALRKAVRTLESNRAKRVTSRLAPGVNFGTRAIQPAYIVFIHTDAVADVRNLPGFTKVEEYGQFKPIHDNEVGACEDFRFIKSPLLQPFYGAGSGTLGGCLSFMGTNVDVYPFIVLASDAWGQVGLKGMSAISPTLLRSGEKSHANPLGTHGFVGANCWFNAVRLNEAWMARIECGVSQLI